MKITYLGDDEEYEIRPISTITGKQVPTFEEKAKFGKDVYNYILRNMIGDVGLSDRELGRVPKEWYDTPSIFEDKELKTTYGEINPKKIKLKIPKKYAGSINLNRQKISQQLKELEQTLSGKVPKRVQTWDETERMAINLMNDYDEQAKVLEKAKRGEAWNTVEAETARRTNINAITKLHEIANSNIDDASKSKAFDSFVEDVFKPVQAGTAESGRTLNIFRKDLAYTRLTRNISKLGRDLKPHEWAEFKRIKMDNPFEVKRFADKLDDPKLKDYLYEFWYNSILSGVPTHVVNVTSNTLWSMYQVPHRMLTSGVDTVVSKLTGRQRTRFLNETIPMMAGMRSGSKRGIKAAKDVFTKGELSEFETKWAQEVGSAQGAFDRSPYPILRKVGKVITIPTKALRAMDVMANSIAYDAQINALARRTSNIKKFKGAAARDFEIAFAKNPPDWAHKEAMEFAQYATFMSEPGKISQAIMVAREAVPGGRLVIPFVNTIGNLLKRGVEMTPGIGLAVSKGQNVSEVIAKQIEGSVITYLLWNKIVNGELIGAAPENKAERERFYEQGKQPWSIKIGDKYYQYRRIEPFNTVISSAAIAYKRFIDSKTEEDKEKAFFKAVNDFKNNLIDSSYFQGVTQLLDRHGRLEKSIHRTAASFVPFSGFWRSVNRAYEVATTGEAKVRDVDGWLSALGQVLPGMSKHTPGRINVWGEDVILEGGVFRQWLPYRWSTETTDPVEKEFERLNKNPDIDIYPSLPSQTIQIDNEKYKLPDDFYREYAISFGKMAKEKVLETINSDEYKLYSDKNKVKLLDKRIRRVREIKLNEVKQRYQSMQYKINYIGATE